MYNILYDCREGGLHSARTDEARSEHSMIQQHLHDIAQAFNVSLRVN